jgi:hypothetical protein
MLSPMTSRKDFPEKVKFAVVTRCRRKCALCFVLLNDGNPKDGQLAHIDRDSANNEESNAAYLCLNHHNMYDATFPQTKSYMPDELREYQRILLASLESFQTGTEMKPTVKAGVSPELFERRVPIYRATQKFVRDVVEHLSPDLKLILTFASDTDEALFLFDESIDEYLKTLFTKAMRLHTVDLLRIRVSQGDDRPEEFPEIVKEQTDLAEWFCNQPGEIRSRFAPFLRLG